MALEVNDSRQIIIEPIIITNINATGNDWHETVSAPFTYTVTGSDKINVNRNGNTLTITGLALGEASITVTSGNAQTTIPIVVADKVLDVPHIRQEQSQWCWAACAQMTIQKYEPDNDKIQHWLVEEERRPNGNQNSIIDPDNSPGYMSEICSIVEREVDNVEGQYISNPQNMTDQQLKQILDSGSPVIYIIGRYKANKERLSGHIRVIYGYYTNTDGNFIYLVHEPWEQCKKEFGKNDAPGNNIHLDIWQRSLVNIKNENANGISGIDRPNNDTYNYELENALYFEEGEQ